MRRRILILVTLVLQVACSPQGLTPASSPALPDGPVNSTQALPESEELQVKTWVDNPKPTLNSRVIVFGSLIKYRYHYVSGIMMSAFWQDETHERGLPNCFTSVNYGSGKCVIDASRFPPGVFVPVTVSFNYGGKIYTAQTGFTPQAP